jgi:hypothetical protein
MAIVGAIRCLQGSTADDRNRAVGTAPLFTLYPMRWPHSTRSKTFQALDMGHFSRGHREIRERKPSLPVVPPFLCRNAACVAR